MSKYYIIMKIHPLWIVCLIVRSCLALIINRFGVKNKYSKYGLSLLLIIMGVSFIYKGYYGSNNETQIARVFWHDTRYIHGVFYILASLYLLNDNPTNASLLILTDVAFSILYRITTDQ
jgi:hypothetical protein